MPVFFSQTVKAMLDGQTVRHAPLVVFEFKSQTMRLWNGFGLLRTNDGQDWQGLGGVGEISALELGPGAPTEKVTFRLAAPPEIVEKAKDQSAEAKGRRALILLQFFDEAWQCLDNPYSMRAFRMDQMPIDIDFESGASGVELTAEPLLSDKHLPPHGLFTDQDQQGGRFPGDRALERVAIRQTVKW